ncbi:MAG: PD40 domain-containing protein [Ignavibacteriae bacterium]|nr:PD40 domain-containing protein [Ignavibacteriota bacterium]
MRKYNYLLVLIFVICSVSLYSERIVKYAENLGPAVNSECDELMPVLSPDGNTLFFCRGECKGNVGGQDIWMTHKDSNGTWVDAWNAGTQLNNKFNNFVASITPDGQNLLLGNVYAADTLIDRGISISYKLATGAWSTPQKVNIQDYYNLNQQSSFFLSNDGKILLMTIERDDSYGQKDIYVSFQMKNGDWSIPMNIGPIVNTFGDEFSPFLASDGISLYFSSNGLGGYGDADIFVTHRLDSTWLKWSKPENIGPDVNTPGWDAYYKISPAADYAYFITTNNTLGLGDIYKIKMADPVREIPEVLVRGLVINYKTRQPLGAAVVFRNAENNEIFGTSRSFPNTGDYQIVLEAGMKYTYRVDLEGYISAYGIIDLSTVDKFQEIENDIELIPVGDSLRCIRNIFFETAKYDLSDEAKFELNGLADLLQSHPDFALVITGHCDSTGTETFNRILGFKRAEEATNYLIEKGIEQSKIAYRGLSWTSPVASNKTTFGKQLNRRVEFVVFKSEK